MATDAAGMVLAGETLMFYRSLLHDRPMIDRCLLESFLLLAPQVQCWWLSCLVNPLVTICPSGYFLQELKRHQERSPPPTTKPLPCCKEQYLKPVALLVLATGSGNCRGRIFEICLLQGWKLVVSCPASSKE